MTARGYDEDFAERTFKQLEGFGSYGFPESHAASFAKIAYASSWMKCHHPDVFCCAILNSQPMGFYAPAQLVRDAQAHGVEDPARRRQPLALGLHPRSRRRTARRFAVRLGLRLVRGLANADGGLIPIARAETPVLVHRGSLAAGRHSGRGSRHAWRMPTPSAPLASSAAMRSGPSKAWRTR